MLGDGKNHIFARDSDDVEMGDADDDVEFDEKDEKPNADGKDDGPKVAGEKEPAAIQLAASNDKPADSKEIANAAATPSS